jgi:hypothetical protein
LQDEERKREEGTQMGVKIKASCTYWTVEWTVRIDAIELRTDDDPPFYIYEMDLDTAKGIGETLDECEAELADDEEEELK